jgi:hypothetical protein
MADGSPATGGFSRFSSAVKALPLRIGVFAGETSGTLWPICSTGRRGSAPCGVHGPWEKSQPARRTLASGGRPRSRSARGWRYGMSPNRAATEEEVRARIGMMDREQLIHELLHFESRATLDFAPAYLATLSRRTLRHLLLAAVLCLSPRNPPSASGGGSVGSELDGLSLGPAEGESWPAQAQSCED